MGVVITRCRVKSEYLVCFVSFIIASSGIEHQKLKVGLKVGHVLVTVYEAANDEATPWSSC